ncbi:MAG: hypothetical protein EZS28_035486, partial [Streblomastix strix]
MIHNLREAERTHFARARNENGTSANYFNLAANSINSHLNSETGSHMLGAQVIARSDTANKDAIGITNLPFGIQQLGKSRVKTKRFRQLTPEEIWKQNSGPRDQSPPGHQLHAQRNIAILQQTIFVPTLNAEQEIPGIPNVLTKETIKDHMHKWMLKGFDLIPVGKDDEGQYWMGFCPSVPHATDWRKSKQQGQTSSIDDIRAFQREHNFDLRVAYKNSEIDSKDTEIGPYHRTTRDQDMTILTGAANRQKEQDQRIIQDLENTEVQEKLEQMRIEIIIDLKSETNQEAEAEEHIEEGEAQKYNSNKKQDINKTKNPTNWNRTYKYDAKNRGEGWDDNPNDDWTKRTQMQKDPPDNHNDRDSTWTEDEAPQHQVLTPLPKQPIQQTQRVQQIQVQPKQQAPAQVPKKKGRKDQPPSQDDIDEQEIIQERLAALQKEKEEMGIFDSYYDWQQLIGAIDNKINLTPRSAPKQLQEIIQESIFSQTAKQQQQTTGSKTQQRIVSPLPRMISTGMNKNKPVIKSQLSATPTQKPVHRSGVRQRLKKAERELKELKVKQQLQQKENNDLNHVNFEIPDIQGTAGQLTGLQPSSDAQRPGLNAGLRLNETGSILASNKERTKPQINECHDDNADEEEDEQTDVSALHQNQDYRFNIISQPPVLENLGIQPQNNQGLNALSQMEKDNAGLAPVRIQQKPKKGRRSQKSKTESLNASDEQSQSNNAQAQTKPTSKFPKIKAISKRQQKSLQKVNPNQKNSNNDGEEEHIP